MDKTINEYLMNFINSIPLIYVPYISTEDNKYYQLDRKYGEGNFRILKFDNNNLLILIADFKPKEDFEKVTSISEKYFEISQFETSNSSFKIGGRKLNKVDKGIYCYLNEEKNTYTYCDAKKAVRFTKIILTKEYFNTFLKARYSDIKYEKVKSVCNDILKLQNSPQLNFIFQQIRESKVEGKILQLYLESKVMEILSFIISRLDEEEKSLSVHLTNKDKQNLKKTVIAMKNNLSIHIDGIELSKIALMSPARFQLAFRKFYGVPPYQYLKELRLNQALFLLKNTDLNISTIAKNIGYNHAGHFSKIFKESYGVLPKEYREMIR